MTDAIINLMSEHNLVNEAELFCSDLKFRVHKKGDNGMMIGDESKKDEDLLLQVSQALKNITKRFLKQLKELKPKEAYKFEEKRKDEAFEEHKGLAVYISCYYHHLNQELKDSFAKARKDENFVKFQSLKMEAFEQRNRNTLLNFSNFKDYQKVIGKSEEYGNKLKLAQIFNRKQIFCVPWLLCPETLFGQMM